MIINNTNIGHYLFIFDINDASPFDGYRYFSQFDPEHWSCWTPTDRFRNSLSVEDTARFEPIVEWLNERTTDFLISLVIMIHPFLGPILAVRVEVPENIGVLFRLRWFS